MLKINKKKNNKGFTLVELLVVIAIIGILAVVAVPALFKNIEKGKVADLEADISAIRSASLSYYADNSKYPNNIVIDSENNISVNDEKVQESAKKLYSELEGLGFPFKGSYKLGDEKAPAVLTLTINADISTNAFEKLKNDLGTDVVKFKSKTTKNTENSDDEYSPKSHNVTIDLIGNTSEIK